MNPIYPLTQTVSTQDTVRVLRLIEYEGPRDLVEAQIKASLHGTRSGVVNRSWPYVGVRITAVTLDQFPQVLEEARRTPAPKAIAELQEIIKSLEQRILDLERVLEESD